MIKKLNKTRPAQQEHFKSLSTEGLAQQLQHKTTKNGIVKPELDPETQMFLLFTLGIVAILALIAWPLSILFGAWVWVVFGVLALTPTVMAVLLSLGLLEEALSEINTVKDLKLELSRRL